MSCCPEHNEGEGKNPKTETKPKGFIGKWLYKVGKADYGKDKKDSSSCCH